MGASHKVSEIGGLRFHNLTVPQNGNRPGIFQVNICERGFIINSEMARLGASDTELLKGQSDLQIAGAFNEDPNARLSAMNSILMAPWANRMIGPVVYDRCLTNVEVSFMGQKRLVPTNFEDTYRLHGLAYANEYHDIWAHDLPSGGIALTGITEISSDQWFSDLWLRHSIGLNNGTMFRIVNVKNIGQQPAPVSVGEHPYFRIPEGQDRGLISMQLPGVATIRLGRDGNPDFDTNPLMPIRETAFWGLAAGFKNLGDLNLNNSFLLHPEMGVVSGDAGVLFGQAGYGIFLSSPTYGDTVNVVHAFAPLGTSHPADGKAVALELQGNYLAPLHPVWEVYSPLRGVSGMHPSSMKILEPGDEMTWSVTHTVRGL